ncbi:MAG: hypothetical protein M3R50_04780 [Bacteroidota bacterium]|nr:hypothetical protein [Bacteroidota bacterium]
MKKYLLILLVVFGSFVTGHAQDEGETRAEKIQSLKIAFITQKLQLMPNEAQKFWPVYNQYQNDVQNLQLDRKNGNVIEDEQKLLDIRKKYLSSFEKIIGPQKTNNLFNAERDFRAILIRRLQNRNQQRLRR